MSLSTFEAILIIFCELFGFCFICVVCSVQCQIKSSKQEIHVKRKKAKQRQPQPSYDHTYAIADTVTGSNDLIAESVGLVSEAISQSAEFLGGETIKITTDSNSRTYSSNNNGIILIQNSSGIKHIKCPSSTKICRSKYYGKGKMKIVTSGIITTFINCNGVITITTSTIHFIKCSPKVCIYRV